jgi:hypothetical protein
MTATTSTTEGRITFTEPAITATDGDHITITGWQKSDGTAAVDIDCTDGFDGFTVTVTSPETINRLIVVLASARRWLANHDGEATDHA